VLNKQVTFEIKIDGKIQTSFSTEGEQKENQLIFSDDLEHVYRFLIKDEEVYLYRTGTEELVLVFRLAEKSGGTLKAEGFEFVMNVYTNKLEVSEQHLFLDYDLLDGNKKESNHQLLVKWNQKRKETK